MSLKDEILTELENSRDTDISGQMLAEKFGLSRNAVWKAIQALKKEGYMINSTTNKGYRLSPACDKLSAGKIRFSLEEGMLPVYIFETLDSSNNEAKRILAQNGAERFLIAAEEQTGGRGRRGRQFYSPKNTGLYMTLVVAPKIQLENALGITAYAAVCVTRAIKKLTGKETQIKWVNDIYLSGRKICGILTEAVSDFESGTVGTVLVGIGINLTPCTVPDELKGIVGFLEGGDAIKNQLAAEITNELLRYGAGNRGFIDEYKRHSMILGKDIIYYKSGIEFYGRAVDIDERGGLVVVSAEGLTETLRSGEITVRERKKL